VWDCPIYTACIVTTHRIVDLGFVARTNSRPCHFLLCERLTLPPLNTIGAQRRLTYKDGTSFIETVVETESDSIVLELSEHPWSCTKIFAHLFTTKVDDSNSVFNVAMMFQFNEDATDEYKTWFEGANSYIIKGMTESVKHIFETNSWKQHDVKGYLVGKADGTYSLCMMI
jgi:hypothetical protein